jgi:protein O-mannosyl-transferase
MIAPDMREPDPVLRRGVILLLVVTFAAYTASLANGFVGWDDPQLVTENVTVRSFDWAGIVTDCTQSNWHPLTLLSYSIEHALVGLDPFLYHLTNLLGHLTNSVLVVALVRRLLPEGRVAPLVVGLLFALHPLHVESVAWISERKDILSTFFFLAAALAYLRFSETKGPRAFWIPFGLFLAALLSKSMAVTLPVVLVLLDVYRRRRFAWSMVIVKWPYFLASILAGVVNLREQSTFQILLSEPSRIGKALGNAWLSLVFYVDKTLRPVDLSCYYEESLVSVGAWERIIFVLLFGGLGLYAWKVPRRRAPILLGLALFLTTLALVLKLIPFGEQSLVNDRYMYIPSIGLFLAFGVVIEDLWDRASATGALPRQLLLGAGVALLLAGVAGTYRRTLVWRDDGALWRDVIANYPETPKAHEHLAFHYFDGNELDLALLHMREASRLSPLSATLHMNLGALLGNLGRTAEAREAFELCIVADPDNAAAHANLGISLFQSDQTEAAERHLRRSLELDPRFGRALLYLGRLCAQEGRSEEAARCFQGAIQVEPWGADPYHDLILLLLRSDRREEANQWIERAERAGVHLSSELIAAARG